MKKTQKIIDTIPKIGYTITSVFHFVALFALGYIIIHAGFVEYLKILSSGSVHIRDILLLFIYLELGATIGIYFKTNHMPVRFLIYVSVTALARMLSGEMEEHNIESIYTISLSILCLACATLVFRVGSHKYPSKATQKVSDI